jgi:radical SAM protein with 4Fe4S-binding SPASM domain
MTNLLRKGINVLNARIAIARGREKLSATPIIAFLEVSNVCNIRCRMCATTFDPRFQKGSGYTGLMDIGILHHLEPILPGLWRAYLMGNGEPLLNKHFLDFAARLKHHGVEIQFNTNGMLLTPHLSQQLVAIGADAIAISMDGADAETFNYIRRGADFDTVTNHINTLNQIKAKRGTDKPRLSLAAVALKDNWRQMPDLVNMAHRLGMGHVHIESLIWQDDPAYQEYYREHSLTQVEHQAIAKLYEAQTRASQWKIGFSSPLLDGQPVEVNGFATPQWETTAQKGIPCWEPWTTIFVTWQGEIHPCCGSEQAMGNLKHQNILDIWNGSQYRKLRHDMATGTIPEGCRICMKNRRMKRAIPPLKQWIKKALP